MVPRGRPKTMKKVRPLLVLLIVMITTLNTVPIASASTWDRFIIVGDAFRIEFYGGILGHILQKYPIEFFHNTVQAWIDYRPWMEYPWEWENIETLISKSHTYKIPVGIATGWHVGDSISEPYNSDIGFLFYYTHVYPHKWRYPNGTIAQDPYNVGLSRTFSGYLVIRMLDERDFYGIMQPQNPYWQDFLVYWAEKSIDSGADGIFFDSPDAIFTFFWAGGWGCKDTWEGKKFIEYLKSKYTETELTQMGIEDIDNFCLRDYLKKKYRIIEIHSNPMTFREKFITSWPYEIVEFENASQILEDPVFKEAVMYWYQSTINLVRNVSEETKRYANKRGRVVLLTTNEYFSWIPHVTLTPYMDVVYVENNQFRPFPYQTNGIVCKLAKASSNFTKPVWIGEWILGFSNPFEPDKPPRDVSTLIELRISEIYSNPGCIMLVPFGTGAPEEGWPPRRLIFGKERANVSRYYRFISENRGLFQNTSTRPNVALVVSLPTAIWQYLPAFGIWDSDEYYNEIRGWARALEEMHVPYDVLLLGMDEIMSTDSNTRFQNYSVLIAPGLSRISSTDLYSILNFVDSGGKLITTPDFAQYDEMNNRRDDVPLNKHEGIIFVKSDAGKEYWESLGDKSPDKELFEYMKGKIMEAIGRDITLKTNAPPTVMITPIFKLSDNKLILSLVNYDYRYNEDHDWTVPAYNITIELKIPWNTSLLKVRCVSPDFKKEETPKYVIVRDRVIITVNYLDVWDLIVITPLKPSVVMIRLKNGELPILVKGNLYCR